jgi:hypothetical protein
MVDDKNKKYDPFIMLAKQFEKNKQTPKKVKEDHAEEVEKVEGEKPSNENKHYLGYDGEDNNKNESWLYLVSWIATPPDIMKTIDNECATTYERRQALRDWMNRINDLKKQYDMERAKRRTMKQLSEFADTAEDYEKASKVLGIFYSELYKEYVNETKKQKEGKKPIAPRQKERSAKRKKVKVSRPLEIFREVVRSCHEFKPSLFGKESLDNIKTIYLNIKGNKEEVPKDVQNRLYYTGPWGYWKELYNYLVSKRFLTGMGYSVFFENFCLFKSQEGSPEYRTRNQVLNGCKKKARITKKSKENLSNIILEIHSKNNST